MGILRVRPEFFTAGIAVAKARVPVVAVGGRVLHTDCEVGRRWDSAGQAIGQAERSTKTINKI